MRRNRGLAAALREPTHSAGRFRADHQRGAAAYEVCMPKDPTITALDRMEGATARLRATIREYDEGTEGRTESVRRAVEHWDACADEVTRATAKWARDRKSEPSRCQIRVAEVIAQAQEKRERAKVKYAKREA